MNRLILLLVPFVLFAGAVPARAQTVETELIAARDTVWRAYFHHDTALLHRFIPPAAAALEGPAPGRWNTRQDIMDGSSRFAQSPLRLVDVRFSGTEITVAGHTAIVRSNYAVIVDAGGRVDTMAGRATELFVRHGGTWVNPYWQLEPGGAGGEGGAQAAGRGP
jgi:hypothetical protein